MALAADRYKYIILGAGAAGLSLCHHLLERGVRDPILILDRKVAFTEDRTWCFWDVRPTPFTDLAIHCWHRWDVFDAAGQATQGSPAVGYACLHGGDFYAHVLETIRRCGNVTLRLGCPAESCRSAPDHAAVQVGGADYRADYIFDSRLRSEDGDALMQRFFGQFVRTEDACFDPTRCTLMDFRVSQGSGLHFFYTLPFSPTEALVEDTYIQDGRAAALEPEQQRAEIAAHLARRYGRTDYTVTREEVGAIPMTARPFPKRDRRVFFIGMAGGCTKPSSGYTFARIQEQCRQIADAAAAGTLERFRERPAPARYRFFDAVFLQALRDDPGAFPGYFHRLFARVPPDALTAFLSETGTWQSDAQIIRSLPAGAVPLGGGPDAPAQRHAATRLRGWPDLPRLGDAAGGDAPFAPLPHRVGPLAVRPVPVRHGLPGPAAWGARPPCAAVPAASTSNAALPDPLRRRVRRACGPLSPLLAPVAGSRFGVLFAVLLAALGPGGCLFSTSLRGEASPGRLA